MIETRWSTVSDAADLAAAHRDAWRNAYLGILPMPVIERAAGTRGPRFWRRMATRGGPPLVIALDGTLSGYALLGPDRARATGGEIYELYLRPEFQGVGLGSRLFDEARRRLAEAGLRSLTIWCLTENRTGCRFYRGLGGTVTANVRGRFGGALVEKTAFSWA